MKMIKPLLGTITITCGLAVCGYSQSFLTNGLVAYYPFSGNANDATAYHNNPTLNTATLSTNRFGEPLTAYDFGPSKYISYNNAPQLAFGPQTSLGVFAWIKFNTPGNPNFLGIVSKMANDTNVSSGFQIGISENTLQAQMGSPSAVIFQGTNVLNDDKWHAVGLVLERTNSTAQLFVDGKLDGTTTDSKLSQDLSCINPLLFGVERNYGGFFTGTIDDVRIYNRALSPTEVQQLYAYESQPQPSFANGLVAYYPFNGNALDASGNGNNGILTTEAFVSDRFGSVQSALENTNVPVNVAGVLTTNLQTPGNVFSLSVWFRENPQSCGQLISFGDSQSGNNFNADRNIVYCGGNLTFYVYPGHQVSLTTTNLPGDNQWHSTVATLSAAGMMLYLDGVLITNNASVTTAQAFSGYWQMGHINGDIDDVRIYNRALSAAEVQQLYLYESTPPQPGSVTNYFSTATANEWLVSGGGVTNATPYEISADYGGSISVTSTSGNDGTYVAGMTNFTGFWLADYVFYLPSAAENVSLTYSNFYVDDRGLLLLNGNPIVATGIPYFGSLNPGSLVYTEGGALQPYSSFVGPVGSVSGVVTNGFNIGGYNTLRVIVNNTHQGVVGPDVPLSSGDGTLLALFGAVSYAIPAPTPLVGLIKAVKPSFSNLSLGTNYQLQVSTDMSTWTNTGSAFTATNSSMVYPQYFDVDNWNQLFFRVQVAP